MAASIPMHTDRDKQKRPYDVVPNCPEEHMVVKQFQKILESDEIDLRRQAVPVRKGKDKRHNAGDKDDTHTDQQRRRDQYIIPV